jgi:hypothetical protein
LPESSERDGVAIGRSHRLRWGSHSRSHRGAMGWSPGGVIGVVACGGVVGRIGDPRGTPRPRCHGGHRGGWLPPVGGPGGGGGWGGGPGRRRGIAPFRRGGVPRHTRWYPPNVGRQGPRGAAVRSRWVGGSWPKRRSPGGSTPYPQYRKWPVAGTHQKKKLFLIKITYESFPATVKADRTRWVYEWGGCKATRKS